MSTQAKKLNYEEWLGLPEIKQRYEIVDGVLLMPPGPTPDHQWVMQKILRPLADFVEDKGLGVVLAAPVDLLIQRKPLRTRQPDILYLNAKRTGIRGRADLKRLQFLEIPPELVVEVLSPSNTRQDIESRLNDYRQIGVLECWLVKPEAETIEVRILSSEGDSTLDIFGIEGTLISQVLPKFSVILTEIFR